ncbi:MAG: TIGR03016 family PEP-CTERM system-associated outer membrane protein, partial [Burkholderiaceae bacterium]
HTDSSATAPDGSTYQHDVFTLVRKPTPFGVQIDGLHEDTAYQGNTASVLKTDSLQATLSAAPEPDVMLGVIGGREHAVYAGTTQDDTTYGGVLRWRPSPRTTLDLGAQHHYFGTGFDLHLHDRLPRSAFDFTLTRAAQASPATFGLNGADSDPALLLGAILSGRTPDLPNSDQAVDELMLTRNLPGAFTQPQQITSQSAQLATRAQLNLVYSGQRNTFYASGWYAKATMLPGSVTVAPGSTFDSRQWGGSLGLYHRLSPQMSGAAEIEWSSIEALGARAGDSQHQFAGTFSLTQRLGRRTTLSAGLRHFASHVVLNSASTTSEVRENQAFAGLRVQY